MIKAAVARIEADLAPAAPFLAQRVAAWMMELAADRRPEVYFLHPAAFPSLLLPWWLEHTLTPEPDLPFQSELAYSTVNGYYYIRLIDNVMDGEATVEAKLLPALCFFHTRFQATYQRYFDAAHPFWALFDTVWFGSAEATAKDASLTDIDEAQFLLAAAHKISAVKIPLAAVCYRYQRPDLIEPWSRFVDALGTWHQMWNDVFDWSKDLRHGTCTYFLSEAGRRKRPDGSAAAWVVREGFDWGVATLEAWMADAQALAGPLHSAKLTTYLDRRVAMLAQQKAEVVEGLRGLAKLAATMT